ncbi:PAX-interacting protein 1 isoform X3 [Drosophila rhopaloa]|uniref:Platelet-derived growth factor (PDGF) family profile domain-containing protein n=1 Tax=Drosophila rhopaloa TaxID=1041015 RepID=A0ABM5JC99_DRORH|nr:PAX-interacting protein 1 isoform X3 [Drosophila rhopaloa]
MQLNTLRLALIFLNLLRLGALANLQNNGRQKVLSDDFGPERDKSSARTQEDLRLRHEQHHLRQQQHQMAWEQQLQLQLQQHLQEEPQSRPVRHHQHKSQPMELAKEPIRQAASFGDDKAKTLVRRRSHYNEYENEDLELHTIQTGDEGRFSPRQWQQIEIAHRRMKEQHQLQLLAERQQQRPLLTTTSTTKTTTKRNDTKSEDNNDVNNIYARNYIAGKPIQKKDEQLGTPEAALRARRLHAQKQKNERALAHAHMNQVLKEATCRVPQKRCQLVQQDPSKIYTPHCTILHRCSEDSGCCPSRSQICAAKSTHNVELHFFVKSSKHRSVIEKRTFVNHTECHCIERSSYNEDTAMANYGQSVVRATILSCTCPKSFEKILQDDGQCRCDCSSGNYDCDWLKRGNEHFAMNDRKCIQQGRCKPPTCEFGPYMDKHGRCPKQHEQPAYNAMS